MKRQQIVGVLLCYLIFGQFVISESKKVHFHLHEDINALSKADSYSICKKDGHVCPLRQEQNVGVREKRLIPAIIFGISIATTIANFGLDIYLHIKGCCGITPKLCTYRNEFEDIKKQILRRSNEMDDEYLKSKNILVYIKSTNTHNMEISLNVKRIMQLTNTIIETLDSSLLNALSNKSAELKADIAKHNNTASVISEITINTKIDSAFTTVEGTIFALAPVVGIVGTGIIRAGLSWYKAHKLMKTVEGLQLAQSAKAQKILGVSNMKKFASKTVAARGQAAASASKFAKFAKFAGVAMSLLTIAIDVYSAVMKIKGCIDMTKQAKKSVDMIKPELDKFKETEDDLKIFHKNLTDNYDHVKGQITSDAFIGYLGQAHTMATSASQQTAKQQAYLAKAAVDIDGFMKTIKTSDKIETINQQEALISALNNITFTWECYTKKIKTISHVYKKCSAGNGTMEYLWRDAVKYFETNAYTCTTASGHSYTTYSETKTYVEGRMVKEGFQKDCILNNPYFFSLTCSYYAEEYTDDKNSEMTGLTLAQTKWFVSKCLPAKLSPKAEERICLFKKYMSLAETKASYSRYDQQDVVTTYNNCPQPQMTDEIKLLICGDKKKIKATLADMIKKFAQYDTAAVTNAYNGCSTPRISLSTKAEICNAKKYEMTFKDILDFYPAYSESDLKQAYDACP